MHAHNQIDSTPLCEIIHIVGGRVFVQVEPLHHPNGNRVHVWVIVSRLFLEKQLFYRCFFKCVCRFQWLWDCRVSELSSFETEEPIRRNQWTKSVDFLGLSLLLLHHLHYHWLASSQYNSFWLEFNTHHFNSCYSSLTHG